MEYTIQAVTLDRIGEAFELVKTVFLEVDAPDYTPEGVNEVLQEMLENAAFMDQFRTGEQFMLTAEIKEKIVGVLSIDAKDHISLCFVDKKYHKRGIARALMREMIARQKAKCTERITLNSTPYAVPFYQSMGFTQTAPRVMKHGIEYTPMELKLRGNRNEQ